MPKVTPEIFLRLADRMSQQYQLLLDLEDMVSPLSVPGQNGRFVDAVLASGDPDLIKYTLDAAALLDTHVTAENLIRHNTYWSVLIASIRSHLTSQHQESLIDGYLRDNNLRVHPHFSTLHKEAVGNHLWAANVFRPTQLTIANIEVQAMGVLSITDIASLGTGKGEYEPGNAAAQKMTLITHPAGGAQFNLTTVKLRMVTTTGSQDPIDLAVPQGTPDGTEILISQTRYYGLHSVPAVEGGVFGDRFTIVQEVERNISL